MSNKQQRITISARPFDDLWKTIRLSGERSHVGRIELQDNNTWNRICGDDWSIWEGHVACRQLGFNASLYSGSNTEQTLVSVQCNGTENSLWDCLVGRSSSQIQVLLKSNGVDMCPNAACRENQFPCSQLQMCIPASWVCDGADDCGDNSDEAEFFCSENSTVVEAVRLVGGNGSFQGRVEVQFNGSWASTCSSGCDIESAGVICGMLGYRGVEIVTNSTLSAGPQWFSNLVCRMSGRVRPQCHLILTYIARQHTPSKRLFSICPGCGTMAYNIAGTRIVGGSTARKGSWPWQVSFQIVAPWGMPDHICGGTLISNEWILTAAHCFNIITNINRWRVILGEYSLHYHEGTEQNFEISEVFIYPNYTRGQDYDIAIIKINRPAGMTSNYINSACLPGKNDAPFFSDSRCFVTGWGDTRGRGDRGILHQVSLPIVSDTECRQRYGDRFTEGMICAGSRGRDACQGDSGGPLVCYRLGLWVVAGVVSWGEGCANPRYPGVYTRVQYYIDWINSVVNE
ncbi:hypothetical protein ScPMuIL_004998 [Solemya velum]